MYCRNIVCEKKQEARRECGVQSSEELTTSQYLLFTSHQITLNRMKRGSPISLSLPSLDLNCNHTLINNEDSQPNDKESFSQSQESSISWKKALSTPDQITAMLSNFSTSFNVVSISIVLPILETQSLYSNQVTGETGSLCTSALIAGMIIGQLVGGALGDVIGRRTAIFVVMALQIFASLGSCIFVGGDGAFERLAVWRLVLGIGCGGVYPLAALLSSESQGNSRSEDEQSPAQNVRALKMLAVTFSTQGVGFVTVPIVALVLLMICGENGLDLVWRSILGFGALPGILLLYLRWKSLRDNVQNGSSSRDSVSDDVNEGSIELATINKEQSTSDGNIHTIRPGLWTSIKTEDQLFTKLVGTAGKMNEHSFIVYCLVFYAHASMYHSIMRLTATLLQPFNRHRNVVSI